MPDLVPLLEDGYGAQIIVARVAAPGSSAAHGGAADSTWDPEPPGAASDRPVVAAFVVNGVPFIFVNAARPVVCTLRARARLRAPRARAGDVVDQRIEWSRNVPPEAAANDFAEELLAPVRAVQHWFERRSALRTPSLEDLLDLGNAFGVSAWAALYRSRAAGRLQGKQFHTLRAELQAHEWDILPRQAYLGGLRDTLRTSPRRRSCPPASTEGRRCCACRPPCGIGRSRRCKTGGSAGGCRRPAAGRAGRAGWQLARLGIE